MSENSETGSLDHLLRGGFVVFECIAIFEILALIICGIECPPPMLSSSFCITPLNHIGPILLAHNPQAMVF